MLFPCVYGLKLYDHLNNLDEICTRFEMEISAETTKLLKNSAKVIRREIKVEG